MPNMKKIVDVVTVKFLKHQPVDPAAPVVNEDTEMKDLRAETLGALTAGKEIGKEGKSA